jgi:hypothetical protein
LIRSLERHLGVRAHDLGLASVVESVDIVSIKGPNGWSPIRRELDVRPFWINDWTRPAGETIVGEHDESGSGQ